MTERFAVVSDIHAAGPQTRDAVWNNTMLFARSLELLDTAIAQIRAAGLTSVLVLGDIAQRGAQPAAVLAGERLPAGGEASQGVVERRVQHRDATHVGCGEVDGHRAPRHVMVARYHQDLEVGRGQRAECTVDVLDVAVRQCSPTLAQVTTWCCGRRTTRCSAARPP